MLFLNLKPLISLLFFVTVAVQFSVFATEKPEVSHTVAVSPEDGSLWIATPSDGLLRLGRNGRVVGYNTATGHLDNDTITALVFDASGTLYILDGAGSLTRYSSVEGFTSVPSFESGIGALSESAGIPYIIKDSLLYSLAGNSPELVRTLPFSISSGVLPEMEIEDLQETVSSAESEKKAAGFGLWALLLALLAGICVGAVSALLIKKGKKETVAEPVQKVEPRVEPKIEPKIETKVEPVVVSNDKSIVEALQESDFGRQVLELFTAHLSDNNYGVEQIATDLGITRIHVNRKLKAQTGYSPSTVFKNIRMTQASKLLLERKLTIAEIARQCGFSTASYFSTAFKDYFNQSPSEYLAAHAE